MPCTRRIDRSRRCCSCVRSCWSISTFFNSACDTASAMGPSESPSWRSALASSWSSARYMSSKVLIFMTVPRTVLLVPPAARIQRAGREQVPVAALATFAGLAVDFAEHDVERPHNCRDIGQHVAAGKQIHGLQVGEGGGADLAFVGAVGAVGNQVDTELTFRRFDGDVDLPFRHTEAFGIHLEMMDGRLHGALHLGARRRHDLVVTHRD